MKPSITVNKEAGQIGNDLIRVGPSPTKDGILDLFYWHQDTERWLQYNNLVVCALRGGSWNNAEMQVLRPALNDVQEIAELGLVTATYKYPRFDRVQTDGRPPNGAEMLLAIEIGGGPQIRTRLYSANDVQAAFVGTYLGVWRDVRYLDDGAQRIDAQEPQWTPPPHGYRQEGQFHDWPYTGRRVAYWGDDGFLQWQTAPPDRARLWIEIRRTPYIEDQPHPGHPWIETVHITRQPFRQGDETWFGYVLP
jgi:hypothetical protein